MGKKQRKAEDDEQFLIYSQKGRTIGNKNISTGPWTLKQNQTYLRFLKSHKRLFLNEFIRRSERSFSQLAAKLKMRTSQQCRSHYQKFEVKEDNSIQAVIRRFQNRLAQLQEKREDKRVDGSLEKMKKQARTGETLHILLPHEKNECFQLYQGEGPVFTIRLATTQLEEW